MITRTIARPIFRSVSRSILRPTGENAVTRVINTARNAINIHPEQQTGSAYLVKKTPTLAGVVEDETPDRRDRTRLSCRASDFDGINQRFSGGNTSTGKTALSVFAWVRPTTLSNIRVICGAWGVSGNYGWRLGFNGVKIRLVISGNGLSTNRKLYDSVDNFAINTWYHIGFTFQATGELLIYVNGKEITPTKTDDDTLASIFDSTQEFEIGSHLGGAGYFDGQIQQPLIWESALTAAEVRDLYLQQYDDITAPDYGWFLDSDTASGLTSSSPALTPTNSPDLYEDDAIGGGDWLNEKGWNPVTKFDGDLITIADGLEVDFSKDVKIKMSINYTTLSNSMELFEFAPNKNARTHFTTRLLWVLTGTSDVTTTGGDPTFTSNVWYDLEFNFIVSSGTMTISVNDVVKATLAGQSPTTLQTLNRIGGGSTPLTALVSGFEVYENDIKIFRLDGLVDSVGGLPLTIGAGISELNYPKRWDEELDSLGNVAANSESFGVARRDGQLVDGACLEFTGTEYATNVNLVGTETVTSSGGTSTPTISAGRIDFTAGTCWGLTLSNGSIYPLGEGAGTAAYDVVNDQQLVLVNSPTWGNQSQYFWNENQGFSLGNRGRFSGSFIGGDTVTFKLKCDSTDTNFGFINNSTSSSSIQVFWARNDGGTALGSATGIIVDGVDVVPITRNELYDLLTDDIEHEITITLGAAVSGFTDVEWGNFGQFSATYYLDNGYCRPTHINGVAITGDDIDSDNVTVLVPALADGSADANGGALTNPAGPWLYEGLGSTYVNFDVVANANQWLEQRWQGAEFDGTLNANINADTDLTSYPFTLKASVYLNSLSVVNQLITVSDATSTYIGFQVETDGALNIRRRNGGSAMNEDSTFTLSTGQWYEIEATFNQTSTTMIVDGVTEEMTGQLSVNMFPCGEDDLYIGQRSATLGTSPEFRIRNVVVKQGTTSTNDQPLLGTSLDLSDNLFHGTDTDNNYIRLTDVNYQAGDIVEQPFSVNDATAGRVSELIQFTFPKV